MLFPPGLTSVLFPCFCVIEFDLKKMKLHIINYLFAVFYQELVSISTEGRTGCLSVLGNVKHKIVCSPDFEALLESSA